MTINGDLTLNTSAITRIVGATTFGTAHLAGGGLVSLGFAPGYTLNNTVLFEGAAAGTRTIEMDGTSGTLTIGAAGVMRTEAGFGGSVLMGGGNNFFGSMTLVNQGLISSQTSGRTVTLQPASLTNQGTLEASNGGVLSISSGYTQNAGVTRVNGGTINSSTINLVAGTLVGTGTINATVNSTGIITLDSGGMIVGTLNATGGAWNGQGSVSGLATASGGTFTIGSGANMTANGGLNVTGTGTIAAANGTAKITGSVSYLSSSNSTFSGIIAGAGKTLTMNNEAVTWTLAGANTYTGTISGSGGISKTGSGTQTLNALNSYTGTTTVGGGTLRLDFANLATPTNLLNSSSALTLAGGTLSVLGKTGVGVVTSQTLGNVTLTTGTASTPSRSTRTTAVPAARR